MGGLDRVVWYLCIVGWRPGVRWAWGLYSQGGLQSLPVPFLKSVEACRGGGSPGINIAVEGFIANPELLPFPFGIPTCSFPYFGATPAPPSLTVIVKLPVLAEPVSVILT
jgi:hypothetical protein